MTVPDFRPKYRTLTPEETTQLDTLKSTAAELAFQIESCEKAGREPRCFALARTKLEESIMWAVKGYTAP